MMKRKFVCSKEMPLSEQVDVNEQTEISEIVLSGYLGEKDLMLLSNMSQDGNLLILDMSGVTELDTDSMDGTIEYTSPYGGRVSLHRYPAGDERKDFDIPEGVYEMSEYAFYGNPYLRRLTVPESVKTSEEHPIRNCENLETVIFKNKSFRMFSVKDGGYIGWPVGMKGLPRLQDIYLYAVDPDVFCFDIFDGLENINDVTLHVPCSCKKAYQNYEVIYYFHDQYGSLCERKEHSFRKFKSIEEFDPADFLEELNEG